jgi:deoxyribodipyrimidine photo-lyase
MNHLVWFRTDLRTHDNQALTQAIVQAKKNDGVVHAAYLFSRAQLESHGASDVKFTAIHNALTALSKSLAQLGISLDVLKAESWKAGAEQLASWCQEKNISQVYVHTEVGVDEASRDAQFINQLADGVTVHRYNDLFLKAPSMHLNKQGSPFKVFTPFKKSLLSQLSPDDSFTIPAPASYQPAIAPKTIEPFQETDWQNPLRLPTTEHDALATLQDYIEAKESHYQKDRDFPSIDGTSKLSVALSLGLISSRQILQLLSNQGISVYSSTYFSEIIWREFYKYLTFHFPELCKGAAFKPNWDAIPWNDNSEWLEKWKTGNTGIPIVDAGMRQLNQTGWMHNRLRMITGMYLTKILQQNWRQGEAYFAFKLADFDFAANNGGWQWVASTGADAVPYFRIFNPYTQSKKFDPSGVFIRKYVPEIAALDSKTIHEPLPFEGITNGYSVPVVDYSTARADTLEKFKRL